MNPARDGEEREDQKMKILIKGAGDLATGIASRLYGAGHKILMTEIPDPLTVRRTVAFSRAVYEGTAQVEDMTAVLVRTREETEEVLSRGDIGVIVDPQAECRRWYMPDVIVDAILAKRNLGTAITDAPFVVAAGPGFHAGADCHCVVETKRGHTLGNVIWRGTAIPNTGIPGNVGGYTTERLIRASSDGIMEPKAEIGQLVEKGDLVALTGGCPVYAQMSGVVRGMLQEGAPVKAGLKIGDIDARAQVAHCHTISDKARAIGGGVLEAVTGFERMRGRYGIVILAAGAGIRFGGKKLHACVDGRTLYENTMEKMKVFASFPVYIVTGDPHIASVAERNGIKPVLNDRPEEGISRSLRLGLEALLRDRGSSREQEIQGVLFSVCDQPFLRVSTLQQIFRTAVLHPGRIVCAGFRGQKGNPVLWDRMFFPELLELTGDAGGRQILNRHSEKVYVVETREKELDDIDRIQDLPEESGRGTDPSID